MRIPVLGRRNYLFCGSDAGGQRAACLYTITATAKLNGLNPEAYLADILGRIADHPINKIDACSPGSGHSSPRQVRPLAPKPRSTADAYACVIVSCVGCKV